MATYTVFAKFAQIIGQVWQGERYFSILASVAILAYVY
jgi:hypothetical protein